MKQLFEYKGSCRLSEQQIRAFEPLKFIGGVLLCIFLFIGLAFCAFLLG